MYNNVISHIFNPFPAVAPLQMGFPAAYAELLLPKLLVHAFSLLALLRRLVVALFRLLGLGDLMDLDIAWPDALLVQGRLPPAFQSVSAMLIREILPVVRFDELGLSAWEVAGGCAVCLADFEGGDEVPRLQNCRHVFHRGCLDRWLDHEQKTCPLCRAPFIPEELQDAFNDKFWAAAAVPDYYHDEYSLGGAADILLPVTMER